MRLLISLVFCSVAAFAGPLEFGLAELNAAFEERKVKFRVKTELTMEAPESFRIEPYTSGGATISGGDLRGLMYGLLEAAEQIRTTGRLSKARASAATPLRGVRNAATETFTEDYWRAYFQDLARNRFNRVHVDFPRFAAPYELPRLLSRMASDYAIDFTLGIGAAPADEVARVLAACPQIHSIAVGPGPDGAMAAEAAQNAGRLVTVDFDGAIAGSAAGALRPRVTWPPSFEISPPGPPMEHALFFWIWGRFGYDAKTKLPTGANAADYAAAREIALWTAAAEQALGNGSEFIASLSASPGTSAKLTSAALAARLRDAATKVEGSLHGDLRLMASLAHSRAEDLEPSAAVMRPTEVVRPQMSYVVPPSVSANQPLTLRLHIAATPAMLGRVIQTVRLHYRFLDPSAAETVVEAPVSMDLTFTIPASEITGVWDMQYYFEVLLREGSGWFEPDPRSAEPLPVVRVIPSRTGPN